MNSSEGEKRVAWISIPAFVSTDRFIIPELAKYYKIDYYIISRFNEEIDFLDDLNQYAANNIFKFEIVNFNLHLSSPQMIREYSKFLKTIKENKYDLIYSIMIGMPYYMIVLRRIIGNRNVLVGIHNVHVPKGGTIYLPSLLYNKYTLTAFQYFLTFSSSQRKELHKLIPKKYCGSVNFVLMDYGQPTTQKIGKEIVFLSFGYIREYKRIDVLIQAAQSVYEKIEIPFKVIIAGSCDNWEQYNKLIKYPELFDLRIRHIQDSEVANLFSEADYFVAPYQDIAQSGSAIIALNYDMPIIASKLEAFEDYIEDGKTGFLIEPANRNQLTDKIMYILKNHPNICEAMKKRIEVKKNNKFAKEAVAELYINIFEKVIEAYRSKV